MNRVRLFLTTFAALAIAAAPVWAATSLKPPPPKKLDPEGVKAWIKTYIDDEEWVDFELPSTEVAAFLMPDTVFATPNDTVMFWSKYEFFEPTKMDDMMVRSYRVFSEVHCEDSRFRDVAFDFYDSNNLLGEQLARTNEADGEWRFTRPDTPDEFLLTRACAFYDHMVEEAKMEEKE